MPEPTEPLRVRKISLNPRDIKDLAEMWNLAETGARFRNKFLSDGDRQILVTLDTHVPPGEILIEKG